MIQELTILIVFYNGQREAARTLYTLSEKYQSHIQSSQYSVLVIDSGSSKPLTPEFVASFGENFEYQYVKTQNPAPTEALRYGLSLVKTTYVGVIIDGAHMLSPGILHRFFQILKLDQNPFVFATKLHLGPFHQNDSMNLGYNQDKEDALLESVKWKNNGYLLFHISNFYQSPFYEFAPSSESNCCFIRTEKLRESGVFDKEYYSLGGGLINLDLFKELTLDPETENYCLIGESTFHQFHGGASTNIDRAEHPIKTYNEEYYTLNGKAYSSPIYNCHFLGHYHESIKSFKPSPEYLTISKLINSKIKPNNGELYGTLLEILTEQYPFQEEFQLKYSQYLLDNKKPNKAIQVLQNLKTRNPKFVPVYAKLCRLYLKQRKNALALEEIEQALDINHVHVDLILLRAQVLEEMGKESESEGNINQSVHLLQNETNGNRIYIGISSLMKLKKWDHAKSIFEMHKDAHSTNEDFQVLGLNIYRQSNEKTKFESLAQGVASSFSLQSSRECIIKIAQGWFDFKEYQKAALQYSDLYKLGDQTLNDADMKKYSISLLFTNQFEEIEALHSDIGNKSTYNKSTLNYLKILVSITQEKQEEALFLTCDQMNVHYKFDIFKYLVRGSIPFYSTPQKQQLLSYLLNAIQSQKTIANENEKSLITELRDQILVDKTNGEKTTSNTSSNFDSLIFTHIQKTAGSSFRKFIAWSCLMSNIPGEKTHIPGEFGLSDFKNTVQMNEKELQLLKGKAVNIIMEHISFDAHHKSFFNHLKSPFYYTILREPTERFVSYYYFFYYQKLEHCNEHLSILNEKSFRWYLDKYRNLMTAIIGGVDWDGDIASLVNQDILEKAKHNLIHKYHDFGLFEDLDLSLQRFKEKAPTWLATPPIPLPKSNRAKKIEKPPFDTKNYQIFKEANSLDFELYNFAKEHFYKN